VGGRIEAEGEQKAPAKTILFLKWCVWRVDRGDRRGCHTVLEEKMDRKLGYARVSTSDQNLSLQVTALKAAGCTKIYRDHGVSGSLASRPAFDELLGDIGKGDTIVIWRLDRLGRSLKHLIEVNELLKHRGAYLESLNDKIDTSSPTGEFVFHILGAVAQLERRMISERTLAGLAEAAKRGRYPGRPRKLAA
jgi:DNA invertase Pin-like site-specific DNA recombinase